MRVGQNVMKRISGRLRTGGRMLQQRESVEQKYFFDWMRVTWPEAESMTFHVPNGGHRDVRVAARLKREGVKRGVPDILILYPRGKYHGCAIELKAPDRNGKRTARATEEQKGWLERLSDKGYYTGLCTGRREAQNLVNVYMQMPEAK